MKTTIVIIGLSVALARDGATQTNHTAPASTNISTKAQFPKPFVLPDEIKTQNGRVYQGVKLLAKTDLEIKIRYFDREDTMQLENIKLADLPDELQKQFGYDPKKADVEEARQKEREKLFAAPKSGHPEQRWMEYDSAIERMKDQQAKADAAAAAKKLRWEEELKEREIEAKEKAAEAAMIAAKNPPIINVNQQQEQHQGY